MKRAQFRKRVALLCIFTCMMLMSASGLCEKARGIESAEDSQYHEQHLQNHIGMSEGSCTGNYVKVRSKANGTQTVGHLEMADTFQLLDVKNGWAHIEVTCSAVSSPDSWTGMAGWVNADYIDCACSAEQYFGSEQKTTQHAGSYDEILGMFYDAIVNEYDYESIDSMGFEPTVFVESLETDGYILRDLNHDGVDELIVLPRRCIGTDTTGDSGQIIAVYTISDGKPVRVLHGWNRSRHYLCKDGGIYNEGSDGAAYWTCCILDIEGTNCVVREGVQTDSIYEGEEAVDVWRQMTEEKCMYDGEIISEEDANVRLNKYKQMLLDDSSGFIPFAEYPD